MLDEKALRNDKFDEVNSVRLVLADGQAWAIPKPWLVVRPVFREGKVVTAYNVLTYGQAVDELIEAVADTDSVVGHISAVASLAAYFLQWHYSLTDRDLDGLLAYRSGDAESMEWLKRVMEIATGSDGPKVSSVGGG
jgi:predicted O-methyltransferase YrrM